MGRIAARREAAAFVVGAGDCLPAGDAGGDQVEYPCRYGTGIEALLASPRQITAKDVLPVEVPPPGQTLRETEGHAERSPDTVARREPDRGAPNSISLLDAHAVSVRPAPAAVPIAVAHSPPELLGLNLRQQWWPERWCVTGQEVVVQEAASSRGGWRRTALRAEKGASSALFRQDHVDRRTTERRVPREPILRGDEEHISDERVGRLGEPDGTDRKSTRL